MEHLLRAIRKKGTPKPAHLQMIIIIITGLGAVQCFDLSLSFPCETTSPRLSADPLALSGDQQGIDLIARQGAED